MPQLIRDRVWMVELSFGEERKIKVTWEISPVDDTPDMLQTNGAVRKLYRRLYSHSAILTTQA